MNLEKKKFEEHAKKHIYYNKKNQSEILDKNIIYILKKLKKLKKIKIVDIGAGDGNLAINLNKLTNVSLTVTDISQIRINRIKKLTKNNLSNYLVDDIMKSKLKSNFYDFVNSDMVIEHVPSDKKMILEINRILKKNGYFRITTVLKNKLSFWIYRNNGQFKLDPTHVREYTSKKEVKKLFKNTNIKITKIEISKLTFNPLKKFPIFKKLKFNKPGYYSITIIGKKVIK